MKLVIKQYVKDVLYSHHETKKSFEQKVNNILYATAEVDQNGGGRSSLPSQPTERIATSIVENHSLKRMEREIKAVESVFNSLDEEKQNLIKIIYWQRSHTLTGAAIILNISYNTAKNWNRAIIRKLGERLGY